MSVQAPSYVWVDQKKDIRAIAEQLSKSEWIAFDTEFIRESTFFPKLEILQVADESQVWLLDVPALGADGLKPILDVFSNPKIIKVLHAAQGDQEALYCTFKRVATPTFDTAQGASLCGYGESIGLANLLRTELGVEVKKGHARTHWGARPLAPQLLQYAAADVDQLVKLGKSLKEKLVAQNRFEWALELSAKFERTSLYEAQPEELALKLAKGSRIDQKTFQILVELLKWREERVRQVDRPRKWVADDGIVFDLAMAQPKDDQHLSTFRGINKGELQHSGRMILAAIQKGLSGKPESYPERERLKAPSDSEARSLELAKVYLGFLSDQTKISTPHLVTPPHLIQILRNSKLSVDQWVEQGLMLSGAAKLMGQQLHDFMNGKVVVYLAEGKLQFKAIQN